MNEQQQDMGWTVASASVVLIVASWLWWNSSVQGAGHEEEERDDDDDYDPFSIQPCSNPDCIRCRKYAQVNAAAHERLASMELKPKRIVQALQQGRSGGDGRLRRNRKDDMMMISPAIGQYPTVLLIPDLTARPIVTDMHQDCCSRIQLHASVILREYKEASQYACWLENDTLRSDSSSSWQVLHLLNQGAWNEENVALCPTTANVVQSLDDIMDGCIFGNIFLSVLTPGTSIERHCGPTNARHRLHVALQIPTAAVKKKKKDEQEPVLTVLDERITWEEGEAFVFDDSLMHSVDYPAGTEQRSALPPRVVLIVDLWHPELTKAERKVIQELYPTT